MGRLLEEQGQEEVDQERVAKEDKKETNLLAQTVAESLVASFNEVT